MLAGGLTYVYIEVAFIVLMSCFITSDMELGEAPSAKPDETLDNYFSRTRDYWMLKADDVASAEGLDATTKQLKKAARKMAEDFMSDSGKKGEG